MFCLWEDICSHESRYVKMEYTKESNYKHVNTIGSKRGGVRRVTGITNQPVCDTVWLTHISVSPISIAICHIVEAREHTTLTVKLIEIW